MKWNEMNEWIAMKWLGFGSVQSKISLTGCLTDWLTVLPGLDDCCCFFFSLRLFVCPFVIRNGCIFSQEKRKDEMKWKETSDEMSWDELIHEE